MDFYLAKTEPTVFSYDDLVRLGRDRWDGVRNFLALKYIRSMKPGDRVFIYHTGREKAVVGVAEVLTEAYLDPNESDPKWIVVDVAPLYALRRPVSLKEIKEDPSFGGWELLSNSRLSVMPVPKLHWDRIHTLSGSDQF